MPSEGVLAIQTEAVTEEGRPFVVLRVRDNGNGIPTEVLPRIFEPFFTTKGIGKGTGLGLALTHEIVQRHSGSIDVESRPSHTEFVVKFARSTDAAPAAA